MSRVSQTLPLDGAAIDLPTICLLCCLALPVVAAAAPAFASVAEREWLHKTLVLFATPVSILAIVRTRSGPFAMGFAALVVVGIALLFAGAFIERFHEHETSLTVAGALTVLIAHILRWPRHQSSVQ